MKNNLSPIVKTIVSHFVAERDKALLDLDNSINGFFKTGNELETAISSIKRLHEANGILKTIQETFNLNKELTGTRIEEEDKTENI
jgi:hypothetical protein